MKKFGLISVFIILMITVIGCSDNINDQDVKENEGAAEEDQVTQPNEGTEPSDNEGNPSDHENVDEPKHLDWKSFTLDDLRNGQFTSLEFQIGSPFDDIIGQWGIPKDEGYMRGGKYYHYETTNYNFFFFDPEVGETVNHIQINPKIEIFLDDVRELLGTPDYDEHDELYGSWVLVYNLDKYTLFVNGKTEDENSEVLYWFLKSEE